MNNIACVILAAGKGKRMKSDLPKVVHQLSGKPLLAYVLESCRKAGVGRIIVVVGFKGELVAEVAQPFSVEIVWQTEQLGTGHAVAQTEPLLKDFPGEIVVMNGDVPCIAPQTIIALVEEHRRRKAAATVLTAEVEDPTGYGRIVRDAQGLVDRIVEEADADEKIRRIREINSGMFCFSSAYLFSALREVQNDNQQAEYYLPDVLSILARDKYPIAAQIVSDPREVWGVNSPEQLKQIADSEVKH
jgi:UDP-N-acetylglucosamine diphosphorylase/glucosamine-1-phosphate N-acetyltransferase